jgi:hypothetical protein
MGWWGLTFPIGTHAVSAATLGRQLGSTAFKVVGTVESVAVVFLWIYVRSPLFILNLPVEQKGCMLTFTPRGVTDRRHDDREEH